MPAESTTRPRPSLKFRADLPDRPVDPASRLAGRRCWSLGVGFVLLGGASLDLGPIEARLGLASGEPLGPFGRVFGYWDPSLLPLPVIFGRIWAYFEEVGPTQTSSAGRRRSRAC